MNIASFQQHSRLDFLISLNEFADCVTRGRLIKEIIRRLGFEKDRHIISRARDVSRQMLNCDNLLDYERTLAERADHVLTQVIEMRWQDEHISPEDLTTTSVNQRNTGT